MKNYFKNSAKDRPRQKYKVTISDGGDEYTYHTTATDKEKAVSNALFRFAEETDINVGLAKWKYDNDKIDVEIEEE